MYKFFFSTFLFLVAVSLIFTKPGTGNFNRFYNLSQKNITNNFNLEYSPGAKLIFSNILHSNPLDKNVALFPNQNAFLVFKFVLFAFYVGGLISFIFLARALNPKIQIVDALLIYLGSFAIFYISLAQTYLGILSLPFTLLSLTLATKEKKALSYVFYALAIFFNWGAVIFLPFKKIHIRAYFVLYLAYVFLISKNPGETLFLIIPSAILYLRDNSEINKLRLITFNLLAFINIYAMNGLAGRTQLREEYYSGFSYLFLALFAVFAILEISQLIGLIKPKIKIYKFTIIFTIILFVIYLFPAPGSPDHISWTQYAQASVQYLNPFRAYTEVILQYPPLSIVIISFFTNIWKAIFGVSKDYILAIKASVLLFYLFTVFIYFKFSNIFAEKRNLNLLNKTLVFATTFSLIIQTMGFNDINIYVIPTLAVSIIALFKKKYLLSGLLMGITISIKWQPMIILPLFIITIIENATLNKQIVKHVFYFVTGLMFVASISWTPVIFQPNGFVTINRSFAFFYKGAAALSGQALNLNWIVTYIAHLSGLHAEPISSINYLNRQISSTLVPWLFQGPLFIAAALYIFYKYWVRMKKNPKNFLTAGMLIFFSHQILNKSAYEKHIFYVTILMLLLYLIKPTKTNRKLLYLFDAMTIANLVFFYGFTGTREISSLFFKFDITVAFSILYVAIYLWIIWSFYKKGKLPANKI